MLSIDDFTKERLGEIATNLVWGLIEDDRESALGFFKDTCDMSLEALEYFGVELTESEKENYAR